MRKKTLFRLFQQGLNMVLEQSQQGRTNPSHYYKRKNPNTAESGTTEEVVATEVHEEKPVVTPSDDKKPVFSELVERLNDEATDEDFQQLVELSETDQEAEDFLLDDEQIREYAESGCKAAFDYFMEYFYPDAMTSKDDCLAFFDECAQNGITEAQKMYDAVEEQDEEDFDRIGMQ